MESQRCNGMTRTTSPDRGRLDPMKPGTMARPSGSGAAGLTARLAEFAIHTPCEAFPDAVVEGVKRSQLDTLGVMIGGVAVDDAPRILARFVTETGARGPCTLIAQGRCASAPYAALVNGTAGDVIGFSDVVAETMNHPSTSICAAVWALAETTGATGREVLAAHAVGLEIAEKIGHGVRPGFHRKGWEPRGLQNTFGAAAACARLLGLDTERTANALGICGAEASGMRAVKGTMSKAYVAGMAARNGVEAALLARQGYTGPTNVFEARDGVLQTFGEGADGERIAEHLGNPWEYVEPGVTYKAYPLCTCTHTGIEATLALQRAHGFGAGDVASITCSTTPGAADWLPFMSPANKFEAKYSMPFAVSMALLRGGVTVADVIDENVRSPEVTALMKKVSVDVLAQYAAAGYTPPDAPYGCRVEITLADGTIHAARHDRSGWEPTTPPSWDALVEKYRGCVAPVLPADAVDASIDIVANIEQADGIRDLMDLIRG